LVAKRGLSVTTYVIFPRPTEPISISDAFLVYVIAENTERGLVSAKRMSQALTLNPSLYQAKGTGPSTDGLDDVILKKALGPNSNVKNIEDYDILVLGSGDGMEDEMVDQGPVKGPFLVIIIVGSVLLFILLCLVVPCIIECRKCRREGKNRSH
jgi:hypothetical protein